MTRSPALAPNVDAAALVFRVSLGVLMLAHGLLKVFVFTLPGTAGFFESVGFPGWSAYVVVPLEIVVGLAMIAGVGTRLAALASIPVLIGATKVHLGNGWLFSNANGGWEFPLFLIAIAVGVALLGGGRYVLFGQRESLVASEARG